MASPRSAGIVLLLSLGAAFPVAAAITCCEVDGKRVCGSPPPPQCLDKAKKVFGKGGAAKEVDAPLTAEQLAAREAEEARLAEEKKQRIEQERRDRALVSSYSSEQELDKAEKRAIDEIGKNAKQAESRLEAALKNQKKLEQEKEFYAKKPLPAQLLAKIKANEAEIAAQQEALQKKDGDIAAVTARFAADKARYLQLKDGKQAGKR